MSGPAAGNFLQQQERFPEFIACFNHEQPHQALNMKCPGKFYERTITLTRCGRICIGTGKINLSTVFAGQNVGVKQVADQVWLVSFMDYDLGFFDNETCRIECAENPFDAKVLPMSPV
jgi:putative transposase